MDFGVTIIADLTHVPLGVLLLCAPAGAAIVLLLIEAAVIRRPRTERREHGKALSDHHELRHG